MNKSNLGCASCGGTRKPYLQPRVNRTPASRSNKPNKPKSMGQAKQPKVLCIGLTNRCNANCLFCSRRYIDSEEDMEISLWKRIVNQCPQAKLVIPTGWGETLLHPHVVEAAAHATRKGKLVKIYTNASLLDKAMSQRLLDTKMWRLVCSVDECDPQAYEKLRRGLSWKTVSENVKRFRAMRDKGGYRTQLLVQMVQTPENKARTQIIKRYWGRWADKVTVKPEFDYACYGPERATPRFFEGEPFHCHRPLQHLTVWPRADAVLCCCDHKYYVIGNLEEEGALQVFNGQRMKEIRQGMASGKRIPTMCKTCLDHSKREPFTAINLGDTHGSTPG